MKILFIDPPGTVPGLNTGLGYLTAVLKGKGHTVKVIDFNNRKEPQQRIEEVSDYDMVGLSIKTNTLYSAISIAEECRKIKPGITVVAGGPGVTVEGSLFLKDKPVFDYAFVGEAETGIVEFIDSMEGKKTIEGVAGVCYRRGERIIENPGCVINDLDNILYPDYSDFDALDRVNEPYPLITSRGCPYNCTYCSVKIVSGKKFRARSPENVINELINAKKLYHIKEFVIADDTFTQKVERAKDICKGLLEKDFIIPWHCYNGIRADKVDRELLQLMKQSGCEDIWFGIESLVPEVFDKIEKGEKVEKIVEAVNLAKEAGIRVSGFFIVGLPGSDYSKDMETVKKAKGLGLYQTHWSLAMPMPKTALWDWVMQNGRVLRDYRSVSFFVASKCVFETADYPESERMKMYYKANLAFFNYNDISSDKRLLVRGLKILCIVLKYDPLRFPLHLVKGFRKFKNRKRTAP